MVEESRKIGAWVAFFVETVEGMLGASCFVEGTVASDPWGVRNCPEPESQSEWNLWLFSHLVSTWSQTAKGSRKIKHIFNRKGAFQGLCMALPLIPPVFSSPVIPPDIESRVKPSQLVTRRIDRLTVHKSDLTSQVGVLDGDHLKGTGWQV